MGLTESLAMMPAASVSGFYLSHPESTYFNVGKIGEDQLKDQARRRGAEVAQLQRLLRPIFSAMLSCHDCSVSSFARGLA